MTGPVGKRRSKTSTSSFGVSRREGHDASAFYRRFDTPAVSTDSTVNCCPTPDTVWCGDSRKMDVVADSSVALVVTSPPYGVGKDSELGVPGDYSQFLGLLGDVFAECRRVLEPGGRIAVNVANLGRKPYRSLSADILRILAEDLGFLLRGEIIWRKAAGAGGNCAWGSWRSPANPVLRDVTERILVASKGRFDRALTPAKRKAAGLPYESTISAEQFMELTLDVWDFPAESARRVGHPAPFPVELPRRLIEMYTYRGDVVLDPFMGSGSTAVACVHSGRRYVGFDVDQAYVDLAEQRIAAARQRLEALSRPSGVDAGIAS